MTSALPRIQSSCLCKLVARARLPHQRLPVNRTAYSKVQRWTASFAIAGYGFMALAGQGMHAITPCDHAVHTAHHGGEFPDNQSSAAESHASDPHDVDHCVVCQFCAQAQLPRARAEVVTSHHRCERVAREPDRIQPPVSHRPYNSRGPPLSAV